MSGILACVEGRKAEAICYCCPGPCFNEIPPPFIFTFHLPPFTFTQFHHALCHLQQSGSLLAASVTVQFQSDDDSQAKKKQHTQAPKEELAQQALAVIAEWESSGWAIVYSNGSAELHA